MQRDLHHGLLSHVCLQFLAGRTGTRLRPGTRFRRLTVDAEHGTLPPPTPDKLGCALNSATVILYFNVILAAPNEVLHRNIVMMREEITVVTMVLLVEGSFLKTIAPGKEGVWLGGPALLVDCISLRKTTPHG